jgi:hypothetical protein
MKFVFTAIFLAALSPVAQAQSQQSSAVITSAVEKPSSLAAISENRALMLLLAAIKEQDGSDVDCLAFSSESDFSSDSKAALWEFSAREVHDSRCGGDPSTSPIRDRYRVASNGEVEIYDPSSGDYMEL